MFNYMQCRSCGNNCSCDDNGLCQECCDKPILDIRQKAFRPCVLDFNFNGAHFDFDMSNIIRACETDTSLSTDLCTRELLYKSERHIDRIKGKDLGGIIGLGDLSNVDSSVNNPDNCSILVATNGCPSPACDCPQGNEDCDDCSDCDSCTTCNRPRYRAVSLKPGECVAEPNVNGLIPIVTLDACGCPTGCNLKDGSGVWTSTVRSNGLYGGTQARDGVWVDADWPTFYGSWNWDFSARLNERFPDLWDKSDLEVEVFFRFQSVKPDAGANVHVTASLTPYAQGNQPDMLNYPGWIDMGFAIVSSSGPEIPWGTIERTGYLKVIVPKGKQLMLHENVLLRRVSSFPNQWNTPLDGHKVPPSEAGLDAGQTNNSRFYAIEIHARPVNVHQMNLMMDTPPDHVNPGAYMPPAVAS